MRDDTGRDAEALDTPAGVTEIITLSQSISIFFLQYIRNK